MPDDIYSEPVQPHTSKEHEELKNLLAQAIQLSNELNLTKKLTRSRANAILYEFDIAEEDNDRKHAEEILNNVRRDVEILKNTKRSQFTANIEKNRKALDRTLTRMEKAGLLSRDGREAVLKSFDIGDIEKKSQILHEYHINEETGRYDGPPIHRKETTKEEEKTSVPIVEKEEVKIVEPIEEVVADTPLSDRVNRFAEVCNSTFGKENLRHTDIRGMASGFYIMRDGEPMSVGRDETPWDIYARLSRESPESNVVLVCNVFPRSKYKSDTIYLRKDYIDTILHEARMANIPVSNEEKERLTKKASQFIKDDLVVGTPDYVRIMYKPSEQNKGLLWAEIATYRSDVVPEEKQGVKALDLFRAEFNDAELDAHSEIINGYNVPYSSKIHRYPLKAMCLTDEDTDLCVTEEATVVVKKKVIKW